MDYTQNETDSKGLNAFSIIGRLNNTNKMIILITTQM